MDYLKKNSDAWDKHVVSPLPVQIRPSIMEFSNSIIEGFCDDILPSNQFKA